MHGDDWSSRRLHFVGIGGAGMSGLAIVAHALGAEVTGLSLAPAKDSLGAALDIEGRMHSITGDIRDPGTVRDAMAAGAIGFASMVFGIKHPVALTFQYIAVFAATAFGLFAISQAAIIEPPAFLVRAVSSVTERLSRRFATA